MLVVSCMCIVIVVVSTMVDFLEIKGGGHVIGFCSFFYFYSYENGNGNGSGDW